MNRRTSVIRAKLSQHVEFVGAVHKYWEWHIDNPAGGEVGWLDFGASDELAVAYDFARRSVQRHVALLRWAKMREGL